MYDDVAYLGERDCGRVGDAEEPGEVECHDLALDELGAARPAVARARVHALGGGELHEAVLVPAAVHLQRGYRVFE